MFDVGWDAKLIGNKIQHFKANNKNPKSTITLEAKNRIIIWQRVRFRFMLKKTLSDYKNTKQNFAATISFMKVIFVAPKIDLLVTNISWRKILV